jgi:hypothetical protein
MSKIMLAVLGTALLGTAAIATEPAPNAHADKLICRTEGAIGSRLTKTRACHTAAEWAELRRQQRDNVNDILNRRPARISDDPASARGFDPG